MSEQTDSAPERHDNPNRRGAGSQRRQSYDWEPHRGLRASVATLSVAVQIHSREALDVYRRNWRYAAEGGRIVERDVSERGSPALARRLLAEAEQILQQGEEAVAEKLRWTEELREDNAVEGSAEFTQHTEVRFTVPSPMGHRYIRLIKSLDRLMGELELLWLTGLIPTPERERAAKQAKGRVQAVAAELSRLRSAGVQALREESEGRRIKESAKAEKDEAEKAESRAEAETESSEPPTDDETTPSPKAPGSETGQAVVAESESSTGTAPAEAIGGDGDSPEQIQPLAATA